MDSSMVQTTPSSLPVSSPASYRCQFINQWSAARHPVDYPSGTAHWSPPVLLAHDSGYDLWSVGGQTTPGTQLLAETGAVSGVVAETSRAGYGGMVVGVPQFNVDQQSQTVGTVMLTAARPMLSTMSMIAPSPDWFTGVSGMDLRDTSSNTWYGSVTVETAPFDAGTDSGSTYGSPDRATRPHQPIFELTPRTVPGRVLLDPSGREVPTVARWECVLVNA